MASGAASGKQKPLGRSSREASHHGLGLATVATCSCTMRSKGTEKPILFVYGRGGMSCSCHQYVTQLSRDCRSSATRGHGRRRMSWSDKIRRRAFDTVRRWNLYRPGPRVGQGWEDNGLTCRGFSRSIELDLAGGAYHVDTIDQRRTEMTGA